jgi:hypothetical protein
MVDFPAAFVYAYGMKIKTYFDGNNLLRIKWSFRLTNKRK